MATQREMTALNALAMDIKCPRCKAVPMEECTEGAIGANLRQVAPHRERQRAAFAAIPGGDGLVHLRRQPDAPIIAEAWCGKRGQATITDASGYYGPEGKGWDQVCGGCVRAKKKGGG